MIRDRLYEVAALLLIGDGVVGMLQPSRHTRLWLSGPRAYRTVMRPFVASPTLTRVVAAAEFAAGVWWAGRQGPSGQEGG